MRAFIPSRGRPGTLTTPALLSAFDWRVVVHSAEDLAAYADAGLDRGRIVASGREEGLIGQKRFVLEELAGPGEWVLLADDDWTTIRALPPGAEPSQAAFDTPLSPRDFATICAHDAALAEGIGARLAGFSRVRNAFYRRGPRFGTCSFIQGGLSLHRGRTPLVWDTSIRIGEDVYLTAEHLATYGRVLLDRHVYADTTLYAAGGIGLAFADRQRTWRAELARIMARYPGLLRPVERPNGALDIRLTVNSRTVDAWRSRLLSEAS